MVSLKAFCSVLAAEFGITADGAYERQRALVRAGVFPAPAGRGRGRGLNATPETVATMIVAFLLTDNLSEVGKNVEKMAGMAFDTALLDRCFLTGATTFHQALTKIISNPALAKDDEVEVEVLRQRLWGFIRFAPKKAPWRKEPKQIGLSFFGKRRDKYSDFEVRATIKSESLQRIAKALEDS